MNNTDESYYQSLSIHDRIEEERIKQGISKAQLSKRLKHTDVYWSVVYSECRCMRISTINKIAEQLDVSLEYLLYGRNYGKYEGKPISLKKISDIVFHKFVHLSRSEHTILSKLRKNKQNDLTVNMYFKIENTLKTDLWSIISG